MLNALARITPKFRKVLNRKNKNNVTKTKI